MSTGVGIGQAAGQTYMTVVAMTGLGEAQEMRGALGRAIQTYREALQLASEYSSEPMPFAGMPYVGLAGPLYERNELDEAMRCVEKGIELSEQARNVDTIADGYFNLARLHHALGHPDEALEAIEEMENVARTGGDGNWAATACAVRSWWWLERGNIQEASRCALESRWRARDGADFVHELGEIAAARALVARASSPEAAQSDAAGQALASLAGLLRAAETAKRMGNTIQILAVQALAFQVQGSVDQAVASLERALSLAEPEGYVRTFVDEGPPMAHLLYEAATRGILPDYAGRLLAAFPDSKAAPVASPKADQRPAPTLESALIEPLSERELEVLHLIAEGLTNAEIASRLYLSLNTVKAHTRNIYGKLDAHSRTQAVARARVLGVLTSA
jgi:LuxR family maltose regulon positive regulatory protein